MKQTILGAGGSIGVELAKVLPEYGNDIRLVNRHPRAINPKDELLAADLTKKEDVRTPLMWSLNFPKNRLNFQEE